MKVINMFSGPGVGKSTLAAGLFYKMKVQGFNVELVQEYAKDMTWERRDNILDDQLYILAKQNRRLSRLVDHGVDYVISDSPLVLGIVYAKPEYYATFYSIVVDFFKQYDNINFYLTRKDFGYSETGRNQSLEEAILIDDKVKAVLSALNLKYKEIDPTEDLEEILKKIWQ